jgi:hypothetical protein
MIDLNALLPEEISDEAAYVLVNIFIELTSALESNYFTHMRQHVNDLKQIERLLSGVKREDF